VISRIEETFRRLKKKEKKAFIPYIMAGDPSLTKTKDVVLIFEKCGADIVEIGVPFTDPLADGPTIQRASERALESGITLKRVINFIKELREQTTIPIVLMTYYNPVFKYGEEDFIKDAKNVGVDGIIIPDLPPDEAGSFIFLSRKACIDTIFLLAPTSTTERVKKVVKATRGFIYYVSITGITGSKLLLNGSMESQINRIRKYTKKPIAVGFGVSTPEEAFKVSKIADGVIVGSAIVKRINYSPEELKRYIMDLREAIG
jgi:tryptophan synthase alpha chain